MGAVLFIVQFLLVMTLQLFVLYYTHMKTKRLIDRLIEFHQFLTSYRQTPRSRIFKKHVPGGVMEPILEADSFLEASVIASVHSTSGL